MGACAHTCTHRAASKVRPVKVPGVMVVSAVACRSLQFTAQISIVSHAAQAGSQVEEHGLGAEGSGGNRGDRIVVQQPVVVWFELL